MQAKIKRQLLNRMNYISGHLDGVKKMIEKDKYCIDVINQNEAVVAAIKKVNEMVLANHLDTCVTQAIKGKNEKLRKKRIKEILEVFVNFNKAK